MATMKSSLILPAIIVVSLIGASIFSISILSSISPPAHSTFPGENSKIAFSSDRDGNSLAIYVMNAANGSGQTNISNNPAREYEPDWAPDGEKIAFTSDRDGNTEIYVMNADGTNTTRLTYINGIDDEPRWSPDGKKIAFVSTRDQISTEIYVMNADGTNTTRLTYNPATDSNPDWAPTPPPLPPSEPIQTFLTLKTIRDVPWGKDVIVTGKLVTYASNNAEEGKGIGGKTITFDGTGADNLPDNVITNADGTFTAKGASPAAVATGWEVQAHFAGDSSHVASNTTTKIYNTVKHNVTLSVSAAKKNVPWSNPTTFTATLTDTSLGGVPISWKRIHFNGTGVIGGVSYDNTTDSSGKAIATGTATNTVASGWTYQAHFAGDELYVYKDSAIKTYNTTKHATSLSLALSPSSVAPSSSGGETYKVHGFLKDHAASRAPLSSKTIIIFTADSPIAITSKTTTTDATGNYIAEGLKVPTSPGIYNIQAHFAGDSLYSAKDSVTKTLTVTAPSSADTTEASTT